jgi:hypothetical protein
MKLVAMLSTGKGTWGHVARLIKDGTWEKVYLITNDFGKENFTPVPNSEFIVFNNRQGIQEMRDSMQAALKDKFGADTEVAINVVSGDGKEHMALVSALLKCGVGIKLMALTNEGVKEI